VDYDVMPEIWVSTNTNSNGTINTDQFSTYLSHEVAEIMSDLGDGGYKVNPGASWPGGGSGNQIGDYEGNAYSWRQANGTVVQPYWSKNNNAWLVPDGKSQTLSLNPIWNGSNYT